ncbi:MAG: hypothetical protein M1375_01815 [Candidatus Thermoplasmatota archaeon]|jgi:uroporphyrinogen decarboxylase|nr:hypothetical protein [Candidatus Thermoplasmatota archaeon]MCL5790694.1 hypothetical protein [Candidatus Thermoplasmatota archaeon]
MSSNFLRALENEEHGETPVWYMRQAGRFLKEYRELRKVYSMNQICSNPEVASSISYTAARILGTDAAIIFSDIAIPMENAGYSIEYREGIGPVFTGRTDSRKDYVSNAAEAIRAYKRDHRDIPVLGFAGGPLTIFSYMNDNPARDIPMTRKSIYSGNPVSREMMGMISSIVQQEVSLQIEAGADAIQIFDSWMGYLDPVFAGKIMVEYVRPIFDKIHKLNARGIYFSTMTSGMTDILMLSGADFLSLDWRTDLSRFRDIGAGLQGNLDPSLLLHSPEVAIRRAVEIVKSMREKNNYIFNLGHGILPGTDTAAVIDLAKAVRSVKL